MIWPWWFGLTRGWRKRRYLFNALKRAESKIWENEFLKHQLWEVRGGMREQYDWLRERVEGAIRRRAELKWQIFYAETGDPVKVMDLPLPPREIETLPDKSSMPIRFYKQERAYTNTKEATDAASKISELERMIERRQPDLDQQQKQLEGISNKVAEIDGSIAGLYELKSSLISMLKKL